MRRLGRALHRRSLPLALLPLLARLLDHLLAMRGARVVPLLAQHLAPLRRQLLELMKILPHLRLLLRRQRLELLPSAAQRVALLGRQRLKVLEALARLVALLGRHAEPALAPVHESLLALRRQAVPLASVSRQHFLLHRREARPGDRRGGTGGRCGRLLGPCGRCGEQQRGRGREQPRESPGTAWVTHYFSPPLGLSAAAESPAMVRAAAGP